jgi:SsrA-binding protein
MVTFLKVKNFRLIAENRKASFEYTIIETLEAGLVLKGSEVKSLRENRCSIGEAFVGELFQGAETESLFLLNAHIPAYERARYFNHEPKRPRKLLLHKRESLKWLKALRRKGMTLIPLSLFFNNHGFVKVKVALAQGKNVGDKRQTLKERDWQRDRSRLLKQSQNKR